MPPVLVGPRVVLRPPTEDDMPYLLAFANDEDLRGYLRFATPMTEAAERGWLHSLDDGRERAWLMTEPATGRVVGNIGLSEWDRIARHAEVGLAILAPADRARGIGGEALQLVLRHAFLDMNLQRVWLNVIEDNPARRLYARLGFREEGRLRRHHRKRGAWRDSIVMGLLREEWGP